MVSVPYINTIPFRARSAWYTVHERLGEKGRYLKTLAWTIQIIDIQALYTKLVTPMVVEHEQDLC